MKKHKINNKNDTNQRNQKHLENSKDFRNKVDALRERNRKWILKYNECDS